MLLGQTVGQPFSKQCDLCSQGLGEEECRDFVAGLIGRQLGLPLAPEQVPAFSSQTTRV